MKIRQIITTAGMFIVGTLLLTACSSYLKPNSGKTTANAIHKTLQRDHANNQLLVKKEKRARMSLPSDVNKALLPSLSVEKSAQFQKTAKRFNVSVKNVSAKTFLLGLVKDTDYNIIISPKVSGSVTLDLKDVTMEDILEVLYDTYGYRFKKASYGYEILPPGLETRIFTVNYLDISRSGMSHTSISSGQITQKVGGGSGEEGRYRETSAGSSVDTSSNSNFWDALTRTLEAMVGTQGQRQVIVNPQAGMILVKAYPSELQKVAKYLDSLQSTMTRQVILEAKILEVKLGNDFQSGIDWKLLGLQQRGAIIAPGTSESDIRGTFSHLFSLDMSKGSQFNTVIDLLSTQGNVQVLSSPRIATLNNQKAVIKIGRDEFFITNVSSTTSSGGDTTDKTQDIDFTPFFSGIALDVTPEINAKGGVILHIHPFISTVVDQEKEYVINDQKQSVPLALSDIRESDNIVFAENGQIVVIGGLIDSKTSEDVESIPGIGRIPMLGSLFRRTKQESTKSELVILLRPIIIKSNTWSKQIEGSVHRFKKLDKGFHVGSHPDTFGNLGEWQQ